MKPTVFRQAVGFVRAEFKLSLRRACRALGFARSITDDPEVKDLAKSIQRELFAVGSALATAPGLL